MISTFALWYKNPSGGLVKFCKKIKKNLEEI